MDSLSVDPHKTLCVPIDCGAVPVSDPVRLLDAFAMKTSYLDSDQEFPRMSDYTLELTRSVGRTLKVWAVLQQLGTEGVVALLDQYLRHSALLRDLIRKHPELTLVAAGPWAITCFNYLPPEPCSASPSRLAPEIARRLQRAGRTFLATVDAQGVTALRASICNYRTTAEDVKALADQIVTVGRNVAAESRAPSATR